MKKPLDFETVIKQVLELLDLGGTPSEILQGVQRYYKNYGYHNAADVLEKALVALPNALAKDERWPER